MPTGHPARAAHAIPESASRPPPDPAPADPVDEGPSLRLTTQDHIVQMLQECKGNVALAARKLGVSRGLIYRRLRTERAVASAHADSCSETEHLERPGFPDVAGGAATGLP
jgi:DNA-binding NtrC family response regulator